MRAFVLSTGQPVTQAELDAIGVLYWHVPADTYEQDGILDKICEERRYTYREVVHITPATLPNYEEKIKSFFVEHLHKDEEVRYFLDGGGYFDVRGKNDEWIRIHCEKDDMICLPAGIYHRYTNDEKDMAKVMRLFQGEPVWTPYNRAPEVDEFPERKAYVSKFLSS